MLTPRSCICGTCKVCKHRIYRRNTEVRKLAKTRREQNFRGERAIAGLTTRVNHPPDERGALGSTLSGITYRIMQQNSPT